MKEKGYQEEIKNKKQRWLKNFREAEERGKTPVLLVCCDFDPPGLSISDSLTDCGSTACPSSSNINLGVKYPSFLALLICFCIHSKSLKERLKYIQDLLDSYPKHKNMTCIKHAVKDLLGSISNAEASLRDTRKILEVVGRR